MTFNEVFELHILNQKVTGRGFQQPTKVKLPNEYYAFPCGYFTAYENGYKLMISGASLGQTPIQEALILDPEGIPVTRDTEDIRKQGGILKSLIKHGMTFIEAFDTYVLNQKVTGWSFQQPTRVRLPNGDEAFPCGYFTEYENGYKLMIWGKTIGETDVQEVMILDAAGVPVAMDQENLDYSAVGK